MQVPRSVGDKERRFVVGELLGEGGMGAVYAGVDEKGEQAAIKFLHPHLAAIPDVRERFEREAAAVCRIRSPFVAPVLVVGRARGLFWIAYRRLFGETLAERLRRVAVLPVRVLRIFVEQVLDGLDAAHAVGVVHRDVNPANILLERLESSERASVLDFGISKYTPPPGSSTSQQPLTSTSEMLGTATYMSPEQVEGAAHVDCRTDLYAVGVVAFRSLTGRLPFAGTSPLAILHAKVNGRPRTLAAAARLPWPPGLEAFFARALARKRDARFATAVAMRAEWLEITAAGEWPTVDALRAALGDEQESVVDVTKNQVSR